MCRGVAGNIPGRRLASRASRIHVGGRLRGSRTRAGGGGLFDRRDSTDVIASSGTSAPSRTPQRASPRCVCEAHSSHGCEALWRLAHFPPSLVRSQPSGRCAGNCVALPTTPAWRARRELSGDVRAASEGQGTAAQWPREAQATKSVPEGDCPCTRVKLFKQSFPRDSQFLVPGERKLACRDGASSQPYLGFLEYPNGFISRATA